MYSVQEPEAIVSDHPMLINGELVAAELSDPVINPATGEAFEHVPHGTRDDLDRAVDAAAEAFKTWSTTPFPERAACLLKFAEEVEMKAEELAKAQTMEQGKPYANSMGEVRNLIASCKRYAETVSCRACISEVVIKHLADFITALAIYPDMAYIDLLTAIGRT